VATDCPVESWPDEPAPDCPVAPAGLSGAHRTVRCGGRTIRWGQKQPRVLSFSTQILSKSSPNFTKLCAGLLGTIPKLFPRDPWKKIREIVGISNLVKLGNIGAKSEKLKIDLLVAIQQD